MIKNYFKQGNALLRVFILGSLLMVSNVMSGQISYTFTNAGSTGNSGPSQLQINAAYQLTPLNGLVTSSNGIQYWTVPKSGNFRIEVAGAKGGDGAGRIGGYGARMSGEFQLAAGTVLKILVGQMGGSRGGIWSNDAGAGGGGSFVTYTNNVPLIVAGGGGGAGYANNGYPGVIGWNGTNAFNNAGQGGIDGGGGGAGVNGTAGNSVTPGGNGASCSYGAGGGGFYTRGGYNCAGNAPFINGESFMSGGNGGYADPSRQGVQGGFGGGAGVGHRASGGGGWSGGGGDGSNNGGGGGGSYNAGANQNGSSGFNPNHGYVVITELYSVIVSQIAPVSCFGATSAALAATVNGGTAPYIYSWVPYGGNSASANNLGAGIYTLTVVDAENHAASTTFTLNQPPPLIVGAQSSTNSLCAGDSVVLTGTGADTYTWSANIINGSPFVPLATNHYTVWGYNSLTGCSSTAAITVSVNARPFVCVGGGSICAGQNFTLQPTGAMNYTYSQGPVLTPSNTSSYTIVGISAEGCLSDTPAIVTVTVNRVPVITVGSGSICEGQSFEILATGAMEYTYSAGPIVSPTVTTAYVIKGTSSEGCMSLVPAICNVNVIASPVIAISGGTICEGQSYTLNPSGAVTYSYSQGPVVTPTTTTSYSICGTSAEGCVSKIQGVVTVTVEKAPMVSAPSGTICKGGSYSICPVGAAVYAYSNGTIVSPSVTTTYSVAGSSVAGCWSQTSALVTVTVHANPTITISNGTVCLGQSHTLSPSGAVTYPYPINKVVTPYATSVYTLVGASAFGCLSESVTVTILVQDLPTVSFSVVAESVCVNTAPIKLIGAPSGGSFSGSGVVENVFVPRNTGHYALVYAFTSPVSGCSNSASSSVSVEECTPVNEEEFEADEIRIFPNPGHGLYHLVCNGTDEKTVSVIDPEGREILEEMIMDRDSFIDLSDRANGIYFVKIQKNARVRVIKIIKI